MHKNCTKKKIGLITFPVSLIFIYLLTMILTNTLTDTSKGCPHMICDYVATDYAPTSYQIYVKGSYLCTETLNYIPTNGSICYTDNFWTACPIYNRCYNMYRSLFKAVINSFVGIVGAVFIIGVIGVSIKLWPKQTQEHQHILL